MIKFFILLSFIFTSCIAGHFELVKYTTGEWTSWVPEWKVVSAWVVSAVFFALMIYMDIRSAT